jgi:DNA processing protein
MRRHVAAVPGPVTSAVSAGCHELVRRGAVLVTDAAEVAELVGQMGELAPVRQAAADPADALEPVQRRVLDAVPHRGGVDVPALAARTGCTQTQVRAALAVLGLERLTVQRDGLWTKTPKPDRGLEGKAQQL